MNTNNKGQTVQINTDDTTLEGNLYLLTNASAIILFAHGSGSSRFSPRNQFVAKILQQAGFGTLLFDLLTAEEEKIDLHTAEYRFDIPLLAKRLIGTTDWLKKQKSMSHLSIGYFGSSTGAGAAIIAAAKRSDDVHAVVSRGGRPDLAGAELSHIKAPLLLIVGGLDTPVIELNRRAQAQLKNENKLEIISGASHLFEEPGTLEKASELAVEWFKHLLEKN